MQCFSFCLVPFILVQVVLYGLVLLGVNELHEIIRSIFKIKITLEWVEYSKVGY